MRKYEPFFSALPSLGHQFEFGVTVGVSSILCYDPPGRVIATVHPNQTWEKVAFDAWQQQLWDVNDTVLVADPTTDPDVGDYLSRLPASAIAPTWYAQRSSGAMGSEEQSAATKAAAHANTPTTNYSDALGRAMFTVVDNAGAGKYSTRVELDIQGNQLSVTDALGRQVVTYGYDMAGKRLCQASMEAGQRWMLNDVTGKVIRSWDERGHNRRTAYDALRRPTNLYVLGTDAVNSDSRTLAGELCYEQTVYGEGQANDQALNLRTRVFQHWDVPGLQQNMALDPATNQQEAYDFKGNLLRSSVQFVSDPTALTDWSGAAPQLLPAYMASTQFDALNRPTALTSAEGSVTTPTYNARNALNTVSVNLRGAAAATDFVTSIEYNARGQRQQINYASAGSNTTYTYDPLTFHMTGLTTTRPASPANQQTVQDLVYTYDPAGNITHIQDDADLQNVVFFRNRRVEPSCDFTYDAIYRLIEASGREQLGLASGGSPLAPTPTSYNDVPRAGLVQPGDGNAMGVYEEQYSYDAVGNFLNFIHSGSDPANPGWSRSYTYNQASQLDPAQVSNRLSSSAIAGNQPLQENYSYDLHGNMSAMPQLQQMEWDFLDRLLMTRRQAVNASDTDGTLAQGQQTWYVYNAAGERVRKATVSAAGILLNQRFYMGACEIYQEYDTTGNVTLERQSLQVMDDKQRIALVETVTVDTSMPATSLPATTQRYQFGNHLGTAMLELDETAAVLTYEEYYPFGSTSYQAGASVAQVSLKRYRYTGKEKDEETGLYYIGARYYACWLGRWTSCDPAGLADGPNLYVYARCNPVTLLDRDGRQSAAGPWAPFVAMQQLSSALDDVAAMPGKAVQAAGEWVEEHPRTMGVVKAVGGAGEAIAGGAGILAPEPTMVTKVVGWAALVHGVDTLQAGVRQAYSGEKSRTVTSHVAQTSAEVILKVDPDKAEAGAEIFDATLGLGLSLGAGALSATTDSAKVLAAQEKAAEAASKGRLVAKAQQWWLKGAEADEAYKAMSTSDKFFYEIGQKTLNDENFKIFSKIANPVERGKAIWAAQKYRALLSEGRGVVLGAGKTLGTGPTPGARALLRVGGATAGAVGEGSKAVPSKKEEQHQ